MSRANRVSYQWTAEVGRRERVLEHVNMEPRWVFWVLLASVWAVVLGGLVFSHTPLEDLGGVTVVLGFCGFAFACLVLVRRSYRSARLRRRGVIASAGVATKELFRLLFWWMPS